jgi:hypothetical protein
MTKIILASSDMAGSNEIYECAVERSAFFISSLITGFFGFPLGLAQLLHKSHITRFTHGLFSRVFHSTTVLGVERLSLGKEL